MNKITIKIPKTKKISANIKPIVLPITGGYEQGYDDGFETGKVEGEQIGFGKGFVQGEIKGYENGYTKGEEVGYKSGYDVGYSSGYEKGFEDGQGGTGEQESVQNPLEYATQLKETYRTSAFPLNYELSINAPNVKTYSYCFYETTGIKKITIKGNVSGNAIEFGFAFRNSADLEIVDFTEFVAKVGNGNSAFHTCRKLREILGELDFSECTGVNTMFQNCTALEKITPKANSIKISIGFPSSAQIDFSSTQAIFDGLATVTTTQTLTLNANQNVLQSQINSANVKGWTVVGGKVVREAW